MGKKQWSTVRRSLYAYKLKGVRRTDGTNLIDYYDFIAEVNGVPGIVCKFRLYRPRCAQVKHAHTKPEDFWILKRKVGGEWVQEKSFFKKDEALKWTLETYCKDNRKS